jgi:C-terminal processing protease CtpA/Prc
LVYFRCCDVGFIVVIMKLFSLLFLISILIFPALCQDETYADRRSYLTKVQISEADKIKVFNETWQTVNRLYFDAAFNGRDWMKLREQYEPQAIAAKDVIELAGVLNEMLGELKTSHLGVSFQIGISGGTLKKFFGGNINYKLNDIPFDYGFSTGAFGESAVVIEVDKGSSADEAGIRAGWVMKSCANKKSLEPIGDLFVHKEKAECLFSDENGTDKPIILSKSFYLKPRSATLRRSQLLPEDILYLKFSEFDKGSGAWLKRQIADHPMSKKMIVDLRGNSGGYLHEVKQALALFFPPKTIIGYSVERDLGENPHSVGTADFYKGDITVLINEKSYSGAEIFAATIQENERGLIVGQKSSGVVLEGITKSLPNNLRLYVAIRDYKTARGSRLEAVGVTPDKIVSPTVEDFRQSRDPALERTLEIMKKQP